MFRAYSFRESIWLVPIHCLLLSASIKICFYSYQTPTSMVAVFLLRRLSPTGCTACVQCGINGTVARPCSQYVDTICKCPEGMTGPSCSKGKQLPSHRICYIYFTPWPQSSVYWHVTCSYSRPASPNLCYIIFCIYAGAFSIRDYVADPIVPLIPPYVSFSYAVFGMF